jgi:hypothetical protein
MLATAAIGMLGSSLAIATPAALSAIMMGSAFFVASSLYMYSRRRATWRAAVRIADAATSRSDLDWTHHRGVIQAHDRSGPRPTLLLAASIGPAELENRLPEARVVSERT